MKIILLTVLLLVASSLCTGDEFENIYSQIHGFILQKEEKYSNNLKDSIDSAAKTQESLSRLNSSDLTQFKQQFIELVHDFEISTPDGNLGRLFDQIERSVTSIPAIFDRIKQLKAYVGESLNWYNFLEKLRNNYSLQKNDWLPPDFGDKIMNSYIYDDDDTTEPVKSFEFANSIAQLNPIWHKDIQTIFKGIQDMQVNTHKLDLLHTVWKQSNQLIELECRNDTLLVFGYNVLLSDVIRNDCFKTANHLQVFALNKVFFDTGVIKPSLDMTVVSPIWETIDCGLHCDMNFKGKHGEDPPKAVDSKRYPDPGSTGMTGHPGGWGGQFIGFGRLFYGSPIHINLTGGRGGRGQNGGRGFDGKNGENVPEGLSLDELKNSYKYMITKNEYISPSVPNGRPFYKTTSLYVGTKATPGTNGGDGGCGGPGGHAGKSASIGFENSNALYVANDENGSQGWHGYGAKGGSSAKNGLNLEVRTVADHIVEGGIKVVDAGIGPAGKDGEDGVYKSIRNECVEIAPEPKAFDEASVFNMYKNYARENIANDILTSELNSFLAYLDDNKDLQNRYDMNTLIEDFDLIERQYFELRKQISFSPYYESLINRIGIYAHKLSEKQSNEKRALNYLYTAVKSRLFAIKTNVNYVAVVNILDYMIDVRDRMEEMKHSKSIDSYRNQFKNVVDKKISNARNMIDHYVIPSIDDAMEKSDDDIHELLVELFKKRDETRTELRKASKNKETMRQKMIWHIFLAPLKVVASGLSLLGPEGVAASEIATGGLNFAESFIDSSLPLQKVTHTQNTECKPSIHDLIR